MNKKIGFIGCGNMGEAMLQGILKAKLLPCEKIYVSTRTTESAQRIHHKYGIETGINNVEIVKKSDIVILAIKPYLFDEVINEIKEEVDTQLIISIAAGISLEYLQKQFANTHLKAVLAMPNTPASVLMAMSSLSFNAFVDEMEQKEVITIFESFGECAVIKEAMIPAVIGISGSSPAYIFMVLDAMIYNGMKHGLSHDDATKFASMAVMGAAKMVSMNETAPDILKENVCSPNGTTIEAVKCLEKNHFEEILEEAMDACIARSKQMSK